MSLQVLCESQETLDKSLSILRKDGVDITVVEENTITIKEESIPSKTWCQLTKVGKIIVM